MRIKPLVVSFLVAVMSVVPVAGKGPTRRLIVSGSALRGAVTLTTPNALANVWSGEFIGAPADPPREEWPRYLVEFYIEPPRAPVQMMYSVTYVRDPVTGRGFLYLPGRGEHGWKRNVATILRDGQDGRWHQASADWSRAVASGLRLSD